MNLFTIYVIAYILKVNSCLLQLGTKGLFPLCICRQSLHIGSTKTVRKGYLQYEIALQGKFKLVSNIIISGWVNYDKMNIL